MAAIEMKDMSESLHADGDAWGATTTDHAGKNPPPSPEESETPPSATASTTAPHEHHHVLELFGLDDYDEYSYSDIADEYEEIMQKLMKNNGLVTELKKFLEVWSFGGVSALLKCCKDMSGSKHKQMLSHEVLSVLDSLSPDKASQTDERQAMLLGFEAMRDLGGATAEKMVSLQRIQRYRLLSQLRDTPKWSHLHRFLGKGSAWEDPDLEPILSSLGFTVSNNRLEWGTKPRNSKKDFIRAWIVSLVFMESFNH